MAKKSLKVTPEYIGTLVRIYAASREAMYRAEELFGDEDGAEGVSRNCPHQRLKLNEFTGDIYYCRKLTSKRNGQQAFCSIQDCPLATEV
jgi:hypothetical protein